MSRPQRALISRGEVWEADIPGVGRHPVVIVTRDSVVPILSSIVCVLVTSSFRGHVAEVELGGGEGLDRSSAANCDNVFTLPKRVLTRRRGALGPMKLAELDRALLVALGLG
ncbi:MAG: type II toxin-antitoxin system PemK/MazF family toxin [Actinobacteria bacterium]|nr:type II toxin-antitoxin system PemK/MazF family toxin [Actinomycetota bacterium]MBU1492770.1 type II toxin-antitoxin system PemK/MazF family toxin [Actinomycetota bacterium]